VLRNAATERRLAGDTRGPASNRALNRLSAFGARYIPAAMQERMILRGFMSLFYAGKPVVCKVHGFCVAGGTDMALCSDLLVIAADAKIGYPPARGGGGRLVCQESPTGRTVAEAARDAGHLRL